MTKRHATLCASLMLAILAIGCRAATLPPPVVDAGPYTCGFRVMMPAAQGGPSDVQVLGVWYPSHAAEADFAYPGRTIAPSSPHSRLAANAKPAMDGAPYPLIVQAHGLYGGAVSLAYCAEYLARHGYVVVATDYEDTLANLKTQMAAQRLGPGNVFGSGAAFLFGALRWLREMSAHQDTLLSYMERVRLAPTRHLLDYVLAQNAAAGSPLHGLINADEIGMMGHSLGGLTTVGMVGGDAKYHDPRVKAAALLSAPVSLWRGNLGKLTVPLLNMHGDHDPASLGRPDDRVAAYKLAPPPKYYIVLEHAEHLSFANPRGVDLATTWQKQGPPRVIDSFVCAFFDGYLKGSAQAKEQLTHPTTGLTYHAYQLPGEAEHTWGTLPRFTRRRGGLGQPGM